ncbi:carboxypeptidase regulatory-like domain-containing protein [Silvibacterium dinghuense]|uniref:Carboxypeptidase regulatory-like domain-containing protein n=2 Tax=Silvibacterium dinghuense TaxID=1560006 RepID=A0A4Q1SL23_9BACT|nr:carboxypeptidase regulatory-like domain-containing protein [Silvibacterium dinghuense]
MPRSHNRTSDPAAGLTRPSQVSLCRLEDASRRQFRFPFVILALVAACLCLSDVSAWAQDMATGALNVTVQDASGAVVNGAQLTLRNLGTNDTRRSVTKGDGNAVLPSLPPAQYTLSVSRDGFATSEYPQVTIQTSQVTNLRVTLAVGSSTQTVSVNSDETPLLDTTSNTIATTVNLKQVEDLPLQGRDVTSFAFMVPGSVDGANFNNLPGGAFSAGANGFSIITNRDKSAGYSGNGPVIQNRIEDVQEMTVQTSELDASQGGTAAMNINFTTRSGTNQFHGRLFEDYRNDALNANSWYNNYVDQNRSKEIINDFGGSVGGPIIKDKAFFFVSLANFREPSKFTVSTETPTDAAAAGLYSYYPVLADGSQSTTAKTVNVLEGGASSGCSTCTGTINTLIAQDLANIKASESATGATMTNNIDLNHNQVNFANKENIVEKFPTLRLDYNLTQNFHLTGAVNESNYYSTDSGAPPYPGAYYANQAYSYLNRNYQAVAGFDWTLKPNMINSFRVGYLYTATTWNSQGIDTPTASMLEQGDLAFGFGLTSGVNGFNQLRLGSLYPVLGVKDDTTWIHGKHSISFGVESSTEIDHYYNQQFVPYIGVDSMVTGDPAQDGVDNLVASDGPTGATSDVEGLYATLTGRMTYYSLGEFVNAKTKQFQTGQAFNLHERLNQTAFFIEDQWKAMPTLTINAGLRWDLTGTSKDETGFYTHPDIPNLWGPTAVGDIFDPGSLGGVQNPVEGPHATAYAATYVHPEPNFGFAWNPRGNSDGWLGKFLGDGKTVVRGSFTFKNYTEGAQNFWNFGSNNGANFNTYYYAYGNTPTSNGVQPAGYYTAGTVSLGGTLPSLISTSPSPFQSVIPMSYQAFSDTSYFTFDPHIQQPYVESWTLGIQRELNHNNVLEVRYLGNVAKRQWMPSNYNETNIFENGFLSEFKKAQANLAASGGTSFAGNNLPIMTQAFAAAGGSSNFTSSAFITDLKQGQVGAFAGTLAGNETYLCSLVGASWSPCGSTGGSYPINFFQENPFAAGAEILEMKAQGFSNYNSLQVDFRQNAWHGMQFDANYTLAKSLGTSIQGSSAPGVYGGRSNSAPAYYTERNHSLNYFPSSFDVRNILHLSGTYDLPFGRGRQFFNNNRLLNSAIGGWTVGTILTYSGGDPFLFTGGTYTFNSQSDSGIDLTNVTVKQLQHQIHPRYNTGHPWVNMFDSKYIASSGIANGEYISPHETAGTFGQFVWLHAPKWINTDMSVNKTIPLTHGVTFKMQGEFLNAFNHTAWGGMNTAVQSTSFGSTTTTMNNPRNIELRANFEF